MISISFNSQNQVFSGQDEYSIFIKDPTGKSTWMHVNGQDTVSKLKEKIFLFQGIPQPSQRLVFSGKDLQDAQTLQASAVSKDSEVALLLHLRGGMQIFIKTPKHKYSVDVQLGDTVLSLKNRVAEKNIGLEATDIRLIYAGPSDSCSRQLIDENTLRSYNIQPDSVIHLVKRMRGGFSGVRFNALDDKDKIVRKFVDDVPDWRWVVDGLNFEAVCKTPGCDAYQKKVWVQKGYGKYNVLKEIFEGSLCPMCMKFTENPTNIGFVNCVAEINGKMLEPERKVVLQTIKANDGEVTTFKEGPQANWVELQIDVWCG